MRHEQIQLRKTYRRVTIPAAWPNRAQAETQPGQEATGEPAPFLPTPLAPEVPKAVGLLLAGSYFALVGAFAIASVGSGYSLYMVVLAALFVVSLVGCPAAMLRVEPRIRNRPDLRQFLGEGMATATGHCSGSAALVQMLIVPLLLLLGAIGMGIAAATIM